MLPYTWIKKTEVHVYLPISVHLDDDTMKTSNSLRQGLSFGPQPVCLSYCLPYCLPYCLSYCLSYCLPYCLSYCLSYGRIVYLLTMAGVGAATIGGEVVSVFGSERLLLVGPLADEGSNSASATRRHRRTGYCRRRGERRRLW